jgi:hypothetical protein
MEVLQLRRSILTQGLAVLAIGLFVAIWRSFSLLDPFFLIAFLCCAAILVGPMVVAGYPQSSDRLLLLRHAVTRACALTLLALLVALVWLNFQWQGELLLPEGAVFFSALLLSIAVTTLGAILVLLTRDRLSARMATWTYRTAVVIAVLVYRFFPPSWSNALTEFLMENGTAQVVLGMAVIVTAVDAAFLLKTSQKWPDEL